MTTPPQSPPPTATYHQHPAPPQDDETIKHIAEILLAAYAIHETVEGLAVLLAPFGWPKTAIAAALGLAGRGTSHRPNARLKGSGVPSAKPTGVVKDVRDTELYYRAAYVFNAARRIASSLKGGETIKEAIQEEAPNTRAHEQARRNRLNIASKMQQKASMFGPLLGWYRDPTSASETECFEADGNNFDVNEGTVIGFPGSVHPNCHCVAGPPHPNGGMVNDAVRVRLQPTISRTFKLKK